MLNQCQFIGNLGADPEIRSFQNGGRVANVRLAVTEKFKDRDGNRQERTEWITVAIFGDGLVGVAEQFLRKGSKIFVQGQWRTRKWSDQNGADRYSTECVLQGPKAVLTMLDGAQGNTGGASGRNAGNSGGWNSGDTGGGWDDQDPPF